MQGISLKHSETETQTPHSVDLGTSIIEELITLHHIPLLEKKMDIEEQKVLLKIKLVQMQISNLKNATTLIAF